MENPPPTRYDADVFDAFIVRYCYHGWILVIGHWCFVASVARRACARRVAM